MYTTGTATKPRRTPATYGKASRRTLEAYQSIPSGKAGSYYGDHGNANKKAVIGQISKAGAAKSHKVQSGSLQTSMGTFQPQGFAFNKAREGSATPGSTATPSVASPKNNDIYDVPSSDEGSASSLELRGDGSRKRRKVDKVATKELPDAVWDDASLQQHIAAEMGEATPRLISLLEQQSSVNSQSFKGRANPVSDAARVPSEQSKVQSSHSAGNRTAKVTKRPASAAGMNQSRPRTVLEQLVPAVQGGTKARPQAAEPPLSKGDCESSISSKRTPKQPEIPPIDMDISSIRADGPRTPRKAFVSEYDLVATRGAELHPLKVGAQRLSSPGQLNILGLQIEPFSTGSKRGPTSGRGSYLGHRLQHSTTPRTKLKDRLHRGSKPAHLSSEDNDEDAEYSNDQSSDSSFKRIPINQQLRHNGVKPSRNTSREHSQQPQSSQAVPRTQNGGPKITYSRQRSYLTESDVNEAVITLSDLGSEEISSGHSRTRPGPPELQLMQGLPEESDGIPDSQAGAPKSIHELREAGTNARLLRDIEALLDDIDSGNSVSIAVKRSGLMDIATKLQQPEFCRRFLDNSLETRLFSQFGQSNDVVADILLMGALLPIMANSSSPHVLSQLRDSGAVDFLGRQFSNSQDLAAMVRSRGLKMSKVLQADIGSFCASLMVSSAWRNGRPSQITGRVVSLQCLEYIVRHLREAGSTSDLLPQLLVDRLLNILALNREAFSSPALVQNQITDTQLALSILESSTITQPVSCGGKHVPWSIECLEKMENFLTLVQECSGEGHEKLRTLALRLCLNLTNNSRSRCEAFSTSGIIVSSLAVIETSFQHLSAGLTGEAQAMTLDNLVLSLGLLINLAEWSKSSRELYMTKHEGTAAPLDRLSRLFQANLARTSEVWIPPLSSHYDFTRS